MEKLYNEDTQLILILSLAITTALVFQFSPQQ